jgi:hypothetical protein
VPDALLHRMLFGRLFHLNPEHDLAGVTRTRIALTDSHSTKRSITHAQSLKLNHSRSITYAHALTTQSPRLTRLTRSHDSLAHHLRSRAHNSVIETHTTHLLTRLTDSHDSPTHTTYLLTRLTCSHDSLAHDSLAHRIHLFRRLTSCAISSD